MDINSISPLTPSVKDTTTIAAPHMRKTVCLISLHSIFYVFSCHFENMLLGKCSFPYVNIYLMYVTSWLMPTDQKFCEGVPKLLTQLKLEINGTVYLKQLIIYKITDKNM